MTKEKAADTITDAVVVSDTFTDFRSRIHEDQHTQVRVQIECRTNT